MADPATDPHSPQGTIYHEKQIQAYCALHALNNILQEQRFTSKDLDEICDELAPNSGIIFNPHRSVLGIGNYDVNVVTLALKKCDKELIWFDKRNKPEDVLNLPNIFGFILNVKSDWKIAAWLSFKHWTAVKPIHGNYYDLDSKKSEGPEMIGKEPELYAHLRVQLEFPETTLFLVVEKGIADSGSWNRVPSS